MSRAEFEELLFYVVELKDKLNHKLDEQCAKINHQGSIINQQGQIVDELCWQLRELSEKVRELRAENRRMKERLDRFCPKCSGCCCDSSTYQNHVVEQYNELTTKLELEGGKCEPPAAATSDSDKSVRINEPKQVQKTNEYAQVAKKHDIDGRGSSKKKWHFGGSTIRKEASVNPKSAASSKTTWYLDEGSIYEPIELSAKPSTRAQLEKISAEVSSVPKPAPRRLYTAAGVDNLAQYFGDGTRSEEEDDGEDVILRPSRVKQFHLEHERGSSKVACSQISDLDQSYLPREEYITAEDIVRFTINSRPVTTAPSTATNSDKPDNRRHAIRSFM
ncbi:uncharacterized protein LOC129761985 [Toxorhynchites rutilus septentrionalis]|uniref:uncharacterized protein LOC129761985 n=1 Tax=Toxorhynchites rutilus septentrionalis TaxID=329112 RepID=UPI00247AFA99|nr:uncharacterized protein LOC129761985 [Toxorhynchites rutilus septentrionalis]